MTCKSLPDFLVRVAHCPIPATGQIGAAAAVASVLVGSAGALGPMATLAVCYFVTVLLSELLHHTAAAAIMFPVAVSAAAQVGLNSHRTLRS